MTYCVGIKLDAGIVFLSDSRTNAGVEHVRTFGKTHRFERPGERIIVVQTAISRSRKPS
jgi:putative proteasome-type protease